MAVFIDLSKAFDCVDHDILLKKIECYGLRGQCKAILQSYLANRKQFVEFCNTRSSELMVDIGVPQGSILGPLLFLLYINDIGSTFTTFYNAFADDITIIVSAENEQQAIAKLNENLTAAANYFKNNKLILNQEKTYSLQFHPIASNYMSRVSLSECHICIICGLYVLSPEIYCPSHCQGRNLYIFLRLSVLGIKLDVGK